MCSDLRPEQSEGCNTHAVLAWAKVGKHASRGLGKANRPNAIEEQEAYKEASRMLRIRKSKTESWKNLIETINSDPWGLPYKIMMDKLRRSQGLSVSEDEESLRKIVEVLFPTGEPRTSFPKPRTQRSKRAFQPLRAKGSSEQTIPWRNSGTRRNFAASPLLSLNHIASWRSRFCFEITSRCTSVSLAGIHACRCVGECGAQRAPYL